MDVAFPYKEEITKALRISAGLIDDKNDTRDQPVIC